MQENNITSDNEPHGIENATHNTCACPAVICKCIVGCIFNSGSLSLVKYPV
jgi:hypothetical protein